MKERRSSYLVISIGSCIGASLLCIIIALVGFFSLVYYSSQEPEGVDIQVITPTEVRSGQTFTFLITIENLGEEAQTLRRVDITTAYLDGFEVSDVVPVYLRRDRLNVLGIGVETFEFQELILEGETLTVEFAATALEPGDYAGDLEVCISSMVVCKKMVTRTLVEE